MSLWTDHINQITTATSDAKFGPENEFWSAFLDRTRTLGDSASTYETCVQITLIRFAIVPR
jgi:hypothetical protein